MKVGIARDNPTDAMLAHENRCVSVVEEIAREMRKLSDDLRGNLGVSLRRDEDTKAGRGVQRRDEVPGRLCAPRPPHHPRVGAHAQELIQDRPRGIPGIRAHSLAFKPVAAGGMERRVCVSSVHQHVRIDDEQLPPFDGLV